MTNQERETVEERKNTIYEYFSSLTALSLHYYYFFYWGLQII